MVHLGAFYSRLIFDLSRSPTRSEILPHSIKKSRKQFSIGLNCDIVYQIKRIKNAINIRLLDELIILPLQFIALKKKTIFIIFVYNLSTIEYCDTVNM